MAITLTHLGTTAHLSDRLDWVDEFTWSPVEQQAAFSTTGALLLDVGTKQAGRPITLDGSNTAAWITRALCDTLQAWRALPGAQFTLHLRGVDRAVVFDHQAGGFSAISVWKLLDGEQYAEQLFVPTFRFLEV